MLTTAPIAHDAIAIDNALVALNSTLLNGTSHRQLRADMLAAVRGATMRLHYGELERAATIAERVRADLYRIGA